MQLPKYFSTLTVIVEEYGVLLARAAFVVNHWRVSDEDFQCDRDKPDGSSTKCISKITKDVHIAHKPTIILPLILDEEETGERRKNWLSLSPNYR